MLGRYVEPLLAEGCDTLILGCTHYPFLRPLLRELVPADISLVDTGAAVARQLERLLKARELLAEGAAGRTEFWTSGPVENLEKVMPVLWGSDEIVSSFSG